MKRAGLPTILAVLALFGCEKEVLTARATLTVAPDAIAFGKVATGESRDVDLLLTNDAPSAALRIDRIATQEGSSAVFSLGDWPMEIAAGESATVRVTYTPDDADPDVGLIEIDSTAIDHPFVTVPLSSERTFPRITVAPSTLELGNIEGGGSASGSVQIESSGDATLVIDRISIRTAGFAGEACFVGAECQEGRCTPSNSGRICAIACTGDTDCAEGYACTTDTTGLKACRERDTTRAPLSRRGFTISHIDVPPLLPGARAALAIDYTPAITDRGSAQLVIESNDSNQPAVVVPLRGRPDNLPPIAVANPDGMLPSPILPGTEIRLTGTGSNDPEGDDITYRWRFVTRPEGSRAAFVDPTIEQTMFIVDRPGHYVVGLEVRDASGLTSTNDARVTLDADSGERVRITLQWDRPGTDLDLHVVAPGSSAGSLGDCFFDNPSPDWEPPGPDGDPTFVSNESTETIEVSTPANGVYTIVTQVVAASPEGPTGAVLRIYFEDIEVAVYSATIPVAADSWDVATLSWPTGRITSLDTIR